MLCAQLVRLARQLLLSVMEDIVGQRARDGGAWLEATVRTSADARAFIAAFAGASRHVGRSALAVTPDEMSRLREVGAHRDGDTRERQAILRALPVLPHPDRFLALAIDACRSGVPSLFEAIACENPYPAAHFPALNFNHMVLTALVTGVALERLVGLGARVTPELVRMANEYAAERRAAGRSVPADLDYITEVTRIAAA